jgi:hypothetical protein
VTAVSVLAPVRTLLAGLVDYAGLFPPAALPMNEAVAEYERARSGADAWVLGRFVVPTSRLAELAECVSATIGGEARSAWRLTALVGDDAAADWHRIDEFNSRHRRGAGWIAVVDAMEAKGSDPAAIRRALDALPPSVERYVEIPTSSEPGPLLVTLRDAPGGAMGKLRTGGVTADAFPPSEQLARCLVVAAELGVTLKATAGLHHPVRGEYRLTYAPDSPSATMYGYLNVLVASALARSGESVSRVRTALDETDPQAFTFSEEGMCWLDRRLSTAELSATRRSMLRSFGSCSFREPVDELRALGQFL